MNRPGTSRGGERGLTLVELITVVAILGLSVLSFTNFLVKNRQAAMRQASAAEITDRSLRIATNLRGGLQACDEIIANYADTAGDSMLPLRKVVYASVTFAASVGKAVNPVPFSAWPTVQSVSELDLTGTAPTEFGDEIMYVSQLNPVTFTAYYTLQNGSWIWNSAPGSLTLNPSTIAEVVSMNRYQFVYDYLSWSSLNPVAGTGPGLRLTEWRSQPVIAFSTISATVDTPGTYSTNTCCPRLTAACGILNGMGYTDTFDPDHVTQTTNCGTCFYSLDPADVSSQNPMGTPYLPTYSWGYVDDYDLVQSFDAKPSYIGHISTANGDAGGQTAGPSGYSFAFNATGASSQYSVVALQGASGTLLPVPLYASANQVDADGLGGTGFPAGFEVGIDGQINSREIYYRMVVLASNGANQAPGTFQALSFTSEIAVDPISDF